MTAGDGLLGCGRCSRACLCRWRLLYEVRSRDAAGRREEPSPFSGCTSLSTSASTVSAMRLQLTPDPSTGASARTVQVAAGVALADAPPVEPAAAPDAEMSDRTGLLRWVLAVEDSPTGDGRVFEAGSLVWRDLPLPFMATDTTTQEHLEARLVGQFVEMERVGNEVVAWSRFVESDDPEVLNLQRLILAGDLPGVSVDVDQVEGVTEFVVPVDTFDPLAPPPEPGTVIEMPFKHDDYMTRITAGRIMGATAVPFPAIAEAGRDLAVTAALLSGVLTIRRPRALVAAGEDDLPMPKGVVVVAVVSDPAALVVEGGLPVEEIHVSLGYYGKTDEVDPDTIDALKAFVTDAALSCEANVGGVARLGNDDPQAVALLVEHPDLQTMRESLVQVAAPDMTHPHFSPHLTLGYGVAIPDAADMPSTVTITGVELWVGGEHFGSVDAEVVALVAGISPPVEPPRSWFDDPRLTGPTPITVTDDGQVFGHIATWGTCHIGYSNECVTPPRSASGYASFMTGELVCDDGSRVAVGQITTDSGHASMSAGPARAKEHYDHTGFGAADIAVGEDEFGIWCAGAVRPDVDPVRMRRFMAADVSGDWRKVSGALDLVGVASVNVPGFPKARAMARVASGAVQALVAAAVTDCAPCAGERADVERLALRLGRHPSQRRHALAVRVGSDARRRQALAARVRGL